MNILKKLLIYFGKSDIYEKKEENNKFCKDKESSSNEILVKEVNIKKIKLKN